MKPSRLVLLSLLLLVAASSAQGHAQTMGALDATTTSDTAGVAAVVKRARAAINGFRALWGSDAGMIDWVFVSKAGAFRTRGSDALEPVTVPADAPRANTAITIGGERLAMVLLPLGGDIGAQTRLLVHEAMHTLQPRLFPQPTKTEPMDGGDLLDRADGRAWLFLELRALSDALMLRGSARKVAANDALAFRAERDRHATPAERERLDALDVGEGLPEYTAWRLTRTPVPSFAVWLRTASSRPGSWVRSVGYSTGPGYGMLLDALGAKGWRNQWREGARMPDMLRVAIKTDKSQKSLEQRAARYDGDATIRAERDRDAGRRRVIDSLRAHFVDVVVVRVYPPSMQVSFDPNGQTPVDDQGTVMRNFRWASADGAELTAAGALVSPTWSYMQVPLGDAVIADEVVGTERVVNGTGWRLVLTKGWSILRNGRVIEIRAPRLQESRQLTAEAPIRLFGSLLPRAE